MKLKAAITEGVPAAVIRAFDSGELASSWLSDVVTGAFEVENPEERPAEFYQQKSDALIPVNGKLGVTLAMTGVSRGSRRPEQFQDALVTLCSMAEMAVSDGLNEENDHVTVIQLFVFIAVDGEVPHGDGYSSLVEAPAFWVSSRGRVGET